jgi:hypothetical protein
MASDWLKSCKGRFMGSQGGLHQAPQVVGRRGRVQGNGSVEVGQGAGVVALLVFLLALLPEGIHMPDQPEGLDVHAVVLHLEPVSHPVKPLVGEGLDPAALASVDIGAGVK